MQANGSLRLAWAVHALLNGERARFFLWSPVFLASGIAAYFALETEPPSWVAACCVVAIWPFVLLSPAGSLARAGAIASLVASFGFAISKTRVEITRAPVLAKPMTGADVSGTIEQIETRSPNAVRITLSAVAIGGLSKEATPDRIRVRVKPPAEPLSPGDRINVKATLTPPAKPALPGAFDFARMAYFNRIGAVGYAFAVPQRLPLSDLAHSSFSVARAVEALRGNIARRIKAALPGETGAIASALITGERAGISEATNDAFKNSGLFHILSISGLHMVVMAGAVFASLRFLLALVPAIALRYPIKKWAAAGGIAGALAYLAISGAAFATVRSALMIVVMFGAIMLDRPAIALRNVALAAFLILLFYPESLFDAGFQMSFAAVTGLVAAYEEIRRRRKRSVSRRSPMSRGARFFAGIVLSTLIASAAVAPFAAYHFHQSQQFAVLANLVAIPICNIIVMPAALATLIAMPFGIEWIPLWVMGQGIAAMTWCAGKVASLPGAVGYIPAIPWASFSLLVAGGLWLALWGSRLRLAGISAIAAGLLVAPLLPRPDVIVGERGVVAVRGADNLLSVLPGGRGKFEIEQWLEHDGDARSAADAGRANAFRCDGAGCVALVKGEAVVVTLHPSGLREDCNRARILVLNIPQPTDCGGGARVIDLFDVWDQGTHALYIEQAMVPGQPAGIRLETVGERRGDRPWSQRRKLDLPRLAEADAARPVGQRGPSGSPSALPPTLPNYATRPEWLTRARPPAAIDDDPGFDVTPDDGNIEQP